MQRKEALQIGKIIADRWWHHNESTVLAKQQIEKKKPTSSANEVRQ